MRKVFCSVCCLIFFAGLSAAQSELEDLRELSIEELLNAQVISSTQSYVRLPEAPSSVFAVTGEQIRRWGIRRLSELVERLVPGATSAEDLDDMILAFRGITADNNMKLLLLLNGHEYNTQWNNGPSSEVELGLMDDIKKVEVLIGPHSALYGSGALIGVINIITKTGHDFSGVRTTGNYGTGNYRKGDLIIGKEPNENLNYLISAGGLAADGYDNNHNGQLNISRFPASYRLFGNLNYKQFDIQTRFTRSARDLYVFASSPTRPDRWTNYDTFFVDGRRSFHLNDNLRLDADLSYDAIETQRRDFNSDIKIRAVGEKRYTAKLTGTYAGWAGHSLIAGTSYRRDQFGSDWAGDNYNFEPSVPITIPADLYSVRNFTPYGRNVYALFGQDYMKIKEKFSILLGFRYDQVEAPKIVQPKSFSPRVAFVYTPNKKTVLKAMLTSGVARVTTASTTSADRNLGFPTILDIDKPEKMNSFELAGSYQPNPAVDFSLNVFYNSLRNIFGVDPTRPSSSPPTVEHPTYLVSKGRIDYVGFEAVASANVTDNTFLRVMHQHVQLGSVVHDPFVLLTTPDGHHLNNYPENMTKLLIDYRLRRDLSLNLNGNLIWNDFSFTRDPSVHFTSRVGSKTVHTGLYGLLNANVVWDINFKTQLIISGYNLFNTQKQITPFHFVGSRVFLAGRNFNVSLGYRF